MVGKKGQGEMFWVIVFAILALLVLAVLVTIFVNRAGVFGKDVQSCGLRGGNCQAVECSVDSYQVTEGGCPSDKQYCCVKGTVG